jgi:glycosyltransferase involved in cell wall biosynthesis
MEKTDVVILTLNSERMLKKCVESVYTNIPVNRLIVIDGGSSDQTIPILETFKDKFHNVKIIVEKGTRATARQKGIENVESDWFIFVDSDVILSKNWYKKAFQYVNPKVGAVWGIEVWSTIKNVSSLKVFLLSTMKIFAIRGGTHDTLIRTRLVQDIKIPGNLHVFEDAYIKDWIIHKGYQVIACYSPFCIHYREPVVWTFQGSINIITDAIRFGSFRLILKLLFAYGFYGGYVLYQMLHGKPKTRQSATNF